MRILIRHGDIDAGLSDPPLNDVGRLRSQLFAIRLVELYGKPDAIVCSPYRRTRETALIMASIFTTMEVKCDVTLSDRQMAPVDGTSETYTQMDIRVRYHNEIMSPLDSSSKIIWYITHTIILERLMSILGVGGIYQIPKSVYLTAFTVQKTQERTEVTPVE